MSMDVPEEGTVFAIEPVIYIPEFGGARPEENLSPFAPPLRCGASTGLFELSLGTELAGTMTLDGIAVDRSEQ